jgi:hypothetical protein
MAVATGPRKDRNHVGGPHKEVWAVRRHLNDELTGRSRWLLASTWHDDIDTRQTASLLLRRHALRAVALVVGPVRA